MSLSSSTPTATSPPSTASHHSELPSEQLPTSDTSIASHAGAGFFCREILNRHPQPNRPLRILVAGCGAGHEAVAIQRELRATVDAVDIEDFVSSNLKSQTSVRFGVASVCKLDFANESFDAIFYHHVIEHVDAPAASLRELSRVLAPGGWLFVGTPNRHRLLSSLGAHKQSTWEATFSNKLADNIRDWKDRLTGRFRNELGAHAGFSRNELDTMLSLHFEERYWLTEEYIRFKYSSGRAASLVPIATHPTLCWFSAPAIYALCRKKIG